MHTCYNQRSTPTRRYQVQRVACLEVDPVAAELLLDHLWAVVEAHNLGKGLDVLATAYTKLEVDSV